MKLRMEPWRRTAARSVAIAVLVVLAFLFTALPAWARIGVMGAMDEEIDFIRDSMKIDSTETVANRTFYLGTLSGQDIVLVMSQVGKVNAALTAQILIDRYKVDAVIFTGVAGAVDTKLQPGDIVIATTLAQHDYGLITDTDFVTRPIKIPQPGNIEKSMESFATDERLGDLAAKVAQTTDFVEIKIPLPGYKARKPTVVRGVIVTGDQFIAGRKKREWLEKKFQASATEMEGAAVCQVCYTYGVPVVIIRAISDRADNLATSTYALMKDAAAKNSASLVKNMLQKITDDGGWK